MGNTAASYEVPRMCRIVIDTCADLTPEIAATLEVDILGFPYILDGVEYTDDIWSTITPSEFYDKLREGSKASTSAISIGQYLEFFTKCAEEGTPTVYLCFTSALSSSYNSACHAAEQVRTDHPEFELYVVDNALPCACGELLAMEAVRQRAAGLSARQLAEWANEAKTYIHGYFTLDSAQVERTHWHRGGEGSVPVVVGVLQPPLPGAEHAELGGEEEHGGKQGVLGPQAVPAGVQHLQVAQVVEGAQHRGKEGEHQEGQPHPVAPGKSV